MKEVITVPFSKRKKPLRLEQNLILQIDSGISQIIQNLKIMKP